ncbi:ParB/RepB/Spo0J family partition protein [uncultured Selenomonas sp.]|uniref:ParB/RepB/Spo0J family partition protein n=1 Tax=uncultured Selenomonas sp. TaxID=159275 RepID=UPI0028DC0206|nr:ParB/RepB/Spo0J family partition protein [uncultured Selenomonas sp.]
MKKAKQGGLGRGLGALGLGKNVLAGAPKADTPAQAAEKDSPTASSVPENPTEISVEVIAPNRFQPRREFDEAALEELRESIARHGILQPLSVRPVGDGKYELIAGERRLRAARLAGRATVPVVVRTASDAEMAEMALIENIQREDLNPIEEARAYEQLLTKFRLSQEELARRVARSRSAIANSVRLLRLAEEVQAFIANGVLSMGQTRPLLALESKTLQREAAEYIQEHELSARGAEALVKRLLKDPNVLKKAAQPPAQVRTPDIFVREAEERLTRSLGTKVRIQESREQGKGRLEISYFSADDLERLLALLTGSDSAAKEDKRAALRAISTQSFTV